RAALRDTLEGNARTALDRYIAAGDQIESRWLVMRVLGISTSALLVYRQLPESFDGWAALIAAVIALLAYGVPTEIARALLVHNADRSAPVLLRLLRPF